MARDFSGEQTLKAYTQLVKNELAGKADKQDLESKADQSYVDEQVSDVTSKVNTVTDDVAALTETVGGKVGSEEFEQHVEANNTALSGKVDKADVVNDLNSDEVDKPLSAAQGKVIGDKLDVIDPDGDGVVAEADNATKFAGHDEDYFAKATDIPDVSDVVRSGQKGVANGVAPLDSNNLIDAKYLPSYVDDVVEGTLDEEGQFWTVPEEEGVEPELIVGERGKIYVDVNSSLSYRWSGTQYVQIVSSDMVEITPDRVQAIWNEVFGS